MPKEIASGVTITGLLFAASFFMPVVGFVCALFIPLPVLYYRVKLGRRAGSVVALLTLLIMAAMVGRVSVDVLALAELLLLGFTLGEAFRGRFPVEHAVAAACGAVLCTAAVLLWVYSGSIGAPVGEMLTSYVARNLELTLRMYENMGVSDDNIQRLSDSLEQLRDMLVRVIPGLTAMSALFVAWINVLLGRSLLESRGLPAPAFGRLNRWKAPEPLVWAVIGCGLMLLIPAPFFRIVGINGLMILLTVYFFQGIGIVSFFFDKKSFPRPLRVVLYALIALQQALALIVIAMGFFDMWLNFRKLNPENGA
jgi:uncharacterized protein YybS (DUF2232 family)